MRHVSCPLHEWPFFVERTYCFSLRLRHFFKSTQKISIWAAVTLFYGKLPLLSSIEQVCEFSFPLFLSERNISRNSHPIIITAHSICVSVRVSEIYYYKYIFLTQLPIQRTEMPQRSRICNYGRKLREEGKGKNILVYKPSVLSYIQTVVKNGTPRGDVPWIQSRYYVGSRSLAV